MLTVCDCFHATTAELCGSNRDHMAHRAQNIYYFVLYIKGSVKMKAEICFKNDFVFPAQAQSLNFSEDNTKAWRD